MKFLLLLIVRIYILISKKGSEKGSDSIDLYCDVLNSRKIKNAWNQCFPSVLIRSEPLLNLCKNKLGGWNVVKDKLIKLPVNKKGEIHFDYMATLVQAIKKLVIKDVVLYADKQIKATKEVVTK